MTIAPLFDYDDIDDWAPRLAVALQPLLPGDIAQRLRNADPHYVEDARDLLLESGDHDAIATTVLSFIAASTVAAYHGTRVDAADLQSISEQGFRPLRYEDRWLRLERALSRHPRWSQVAHKFPAVVDRMQSGSTGKRDGQVHFTLSKAGFGSFEHYLTHGSEADQHMARELLGGDSYAALAADGVPTCFKIGVPGPVALKAAHPFASAESQLGQGELPNIVRPVLDAFAFRMVKPGYQSSSLQIDCGLVFYGTVPANWIIASEPIDLSAL